MSRFWCCMLLAYVLSFSELSAVRALQPPRKYTVIVMMNALYTHLREFLLSVRLQKMVVLY